MNPVDALPEPARSGVIDALRHGCILRRVRGRTLAFQLAAEDGVWYIWDVCDAEKRETRLTADSCTCGAPQPCEHRRAVQWMS